MGRILRGWGLEMLFEMEIRELSFLILLFIFTHICFIA